MAGERYATEYGKFNKKYNINFSISDHYDFKKKMNALDNFIFDANHKNAALNLYVDTLASALSVKLENISKIKEGRLYKAVDFSIGDFIDDFDKLMQAKFADEAQAEKTANTHKPLEGATYTEIANAVWKRVKHFDKPTPDVWADSLINGDLTLEDIKNVVEPAKARLDDNDTWEDSDYYNTYIAKQALDKAIATRSFLWKAWPGNWGQWYREIQYAKQLELDLLKYSLSNNAPDEDTLKELTEKSMFNSAKSLLNKFLKEKAAENKIAPDAIEEIPDEKSIEKIEVMIDEKEEILDEKSPEEIEAMIEKKALEENEKIEKKALEKNEKVEKKNQLTFKKPTTIADVKILFMNKKLSQAIKNQFVDLMEKSTNSNANKEAIAETAHRSFGMMLSDPWKNQSNMPAHAIKLFKNAYLAIKNETPGMSVRDKLVAAQKMADIMLNTYSPVASNSALAQYADNYGVKYMANWDIQTLTGYEGNIVELMNDVKVELGITKAKVQFADGEFNESSVNKADKIEEKKQNVPNLEIK